MIGWLVAENSRFYTKQHNEPISASLSRHVMKSITSRESKYDFSGFSGRVSFQAGQVALCETVGARLRSEGVYYGCKQTLDESGETPTYSARAKRSWILDRLVKMKNL